MDFPQSKRHLVIDYLREKYGEVYQVRTFGEMDTDGAKQRARQALDTKVDTKESLALAEKFKGRIDHYSTHASAIVVFADDPYSFCSIERQTDAKGNIFYVVAHAFEDMEKQGLLKQDILGLRTLDVIQGTLDSIDTQIDIDNLPDVDKMTFDMLCRGDTSGCFQIESPGMTKLVVDMQPKNKWDLVPLVALFRPGPKDAVLEGTGLTMLDIFVQCRQGRREVEYVHEDLHSILGSTHGIILYQEQILQIAKEFCGYTLGQADMLRRAVGKKKKEEMDRIIPEFISRGVEHGYDETILHTIADQIVTFANYGFNMGHSAAYGYIAYQTAYLKAHYPIEYMVALINSVIDKKEKVFQYVKECENLGIPILPPDINMSDRLCKREGYGIRLGLYCISGVGNNLPEYDKPVKDFVDFMSRYPKFNKGTAESLISAGAFGEDIGLLLAQLEWFKDSKNGYARKVECELKIRENVLACKQKRVDEWRNKLRLVGRIEDVKPIDNVDKLSLQQSVLGFTFEEKLNYYDLSLANGVSRIGGECVKFKKHIDSKGGQMAFVDIRTMEGVHELVMFASVYQEMEVGGVYIVQLSGGNKIRDVVQARRA